VHRFSLTFRTLSVPQMRRRLEAAGFRIDAVLGDYDGGPWDARADTWVILAQEGRREPEGPALLVRHTPRLLYPVPAEW
jgi:hypothetical protein